MINNRKNGVLVTHKLFIWGKYRWVYYEEIEFLFFIEIGNKF